MQKTKLSTYLSVLFKQYICKNRSLNKDNLAEKDIIIIKY